MQEDLSVRDYDSDILNLQPDCDYDIQVSSGHSNPHIDRITPSQQRVKVTEADIRSINILAFRRMYQMDISGNVVTDYKHLPFLKVCTCYLCLCCLKKSFQNMILH